MYRRLPVCRIADFQSARFEGFPKVSGLYRALPTGSRRHSRLETCGTPCTADFQSAVSRISNPRGLGVFRRFRVCTGPCRLEVGDTAGWKPAAHLVPQTSCLPCRRFPIRKVWFFFGVTGLPRVLPTGSRRYPPAWRQAGSRLETYTCGTAIPELFSQKTMDRFLA